MTKTIFAPGRAVSTTWLNGSQYLGPANPGVVFVANPVNDWEYPLLKGTSIDLPDFAQYFVARSGAQSIDDVKTFTSIPVFPTSIQTTGLQGVNVTRLNTDLNSLSGTLTAAFTAQNAINTAAISALTTNLNTNFVTLATTQSITGAKNFTDLQTSAPTLPANPVTLQYFNDFGVRNSGDQTVNGIKTFTSLKIPNIPTVAADPVNLFYFNDNAVTLSSNQTINGTKTFSDIQVPTPNSTNDAVPLAFLQAAIASTATVNCLKFGNFQIIFGITPITGVWSAGGPLTTGSSNYITYAPSMSAFTSITAYGATCNRLVAVQMEPSLTNLNFFADAVGPVAQPDDGLIGWFVSGTF
jgi:hypothetical protein